MKNKDVQQKSGILLTLTLFVIFTVCILILLLSGASIYKNITEKSNKIYDIRTASQYITTKVRQYDKNGNITVNVYDDTDILVLKENIEGEEYNTYIYLFNGYMTELFCSADSDFDMSYGEKIIPLNTLAFELESNVLNIDIISSDNISQSLTLFIQSIKEESL